MHALGSSWIVLAVGVLIIVLHEIDVVSPWQALLVLLMIDLGHF